MATIEEAKREIPVTADVDVLVAGGGLSGTAAAIAAARAGAKTLLIEADGALGGVATTGLMSSMGNTFFDEQGKIIVHGLAEEILDRVAARGGTSPNWKAPWVPKVPFDPEIFITVLEEMVTEAGARVLFHTEVVSVTKAQDGKIKGVILENKSGRQTAFARCLVDATGDADLAAAAGAEFNLKPTSSSTMLFRMGNVNLQATYEFIMEHADEFPSELDVPLSAEDFQRNWLENGFFYYPHGYGVTLGIVQRTLWAGKFQKEKGRCTNLQLFGMDGLSVKRKPDSPASDGLRSNNTIIINTGSFIVDSFDAASISFSEIEGRRIAYEMAERARKNLPGFEKAFIIAISKHLGIRYSRRIYGEYTLTKEQAEKGERFEDTVALARLHGFQKFDIPYRIILPQKVENLTIASGKNVSTNPRGLLRGQTICVQLGQAAGVAAALSAKSGKPPRQIDINDLQKALIGQGVYLGDEGRLKKLGLH